MIWKFKSQVLSLHVRVPSGDLVPACKAALSIYEESFTNILLCIIYVGGRCGLVYEWGRFKSERA